MRYIIDHNTICALHRKLATNSEIGPTFVSVTENDCSVRSVPFWVLVLIAHLEEGVT